MKTITHAQHWPDHNSYYIIEETQRFKDIFEFSTFKNKKIIYVDENGEFRKHEDIWNEVKTFVGL